jgi:HK97 family phage prohead protease
MRLNKHYPIAYFKALPEEGNGVFKAIVSVIGNVDYQGDRVMPGAFDASLAKWRKSDRPISVIWSHDWADPFANVGVVWPKDVREVGPDEYPEVPGGGLLVKGRFDIEKPFAAQVYDLVKERRVSEWSFAYDTVKERKAADGANELHALDLIEVGPTLKGANNMTTTIEAKSRLAKAAREEEEYYEAISVANDVDPTGELAIALLKKSLGKAQLKPWHIEEQDGKFCVIKDSDGTTEDCHDTREEAMAHMRALYASESDKEKSMKAAMPDTPEAMRQHLESQHGTDMADVADMSMDDMMAMHNDMHASDGADHTHEGMMSKAEAKWDGDAAMASAHNAADFRKIAFERNNDSDPDTAAHWALPHHTSPDADADPGGVSAALGALSGGRGGEPDLKDAGAARSHLEAHSSSFDKADDDGNSEGEKATEPDGEKAGRRLSSKTETALKSALDALESAADSLRGVLETGEEVAVEKTEEKGVEEVETKNDPDADLKALLDEII